MYSTMYMYISVTNNISLTQINGKIVSWEHIRQLYYIATETTGLTTIPKLKYEHVYLTGFSKMRVDLAAQACV